MLKEQTVKGIKWTTASTLIIGLSGPVFLYIQSVFFIPAEFAIISLIAVFISLFKVLEDAGLSQSIVQKDVNNEQLSSLLLFNITITILLAFLLYIFSNTFALLFNYSDFSRLLKLVSIIIIISGPTMIFKAILQKGMYFQIISIVEIIRKIILIVSATIFFALNFGIAGFIYGNIISYLISLVLFFYYSFKKTKYKPTLFFNFNEIKPFLSFGIFIALKNITAEITHNIDKLIIGIFLSKEVLGLYSYAKQLLDQVRVLLTTSFSSVLFSLFSKIKNSVPILRETYLKISKFIAMISLPIFIGIFLTADEFVLVFLGENWLGIELFLKILVFPILLLSLTAGLSNPILYSLGDSKTSFRIDLFSSIIYISLLFILSRYGIVFVTAVYSFYVLLKVLMLQYFSLKSINCKIKNYLDIVLLKNSLPVLLLIIFFNIFQILINVNSVFTLTIIIGMSSIVYLVSTLLFNRKSFLELIMLSLGK